MYFCKNQPKPICFPFQNKKNVKQAKNSIVTRKELFKKSFNVLKLLADDYHLLYQLPTGGGKTVIFSEIVSQYLKTHKKKVLVMTHRIELCKQTSSVLTEFGVQNKVIDSKANLEDQLSLIVLLRWLKPSIID